MRSDEEGVAKARECWGLSYNCAESVLRGISYSHGVDLTDQAKMMATPFGGGIGRAEDICGALTGGVMGIGLVLGRRNPDEDRLRSYECARRLHRMFLERFGSTCCKVLNKSDFQSPDHRPRCGRYVEECTRMALAAIREA